MRVDSIYVIDDILYNYRIYGKSASHACKLQHILDTDFATKYVLCKLKKYSLLNSEMYDLVMLAYLKMIQPRLEKLFCDKEISEDDCRNIQSSRIYIRSWQVELPDNFRMTDFIFLKLFRYKQYWFLKLFVVLKKWKEF